MRKGFYFIIILVIAGGGFFLIQQSKTKQTHETQPTIQYEQGISQSVTVNQESLSPQANNITQPTDETPGWKTYTSTDGSISFKYPMGWVVNMSKDEYSNNTFVIIKGPNHFVMSYTGGSIYEGRFSPGYISFSREIQIPNYGSLFITHIGNGNEKKVAFVALLSAKYPPGIAETMSTSYPSKKDPSKWSGFIGSYQMPNAGGGSSYFEPDEFANRPEVKVAEKIFATLTYY